MKASRSLRQMFSRPVRSQASTVLRTVAAFGAIVAVTATASSAAAQDKAIEDEFSIQRFQPAPGPNNYFTARGARVEGDMAWSAGLFANYAFEPFVVKSCESETNCDDANAVQGDDVKVVENMITADLMGSLTLIDRLQLGLRLPVVFNDGQGITEEGTSDPKGLSGAGLGDVELEVKARAYGETSDPFVLGAALFATGPLGTTTSEGNYLGDSTPSVGLRGIFDGREGPFNFGGNLAGVFRGSGRVGSTELGPEFRYNIAAGYGISPVIKVILEGFGSTKFSADNGTNALEAVLGAQITPLSSPISISVGGGTGVIQGIGVPTVRGFLGVIYAVGKKDRDGDGIEDDQDQCPTEAEDNPGDTDGCPGGDRDGDTIADSMDKCPNKAEDPDGFEDTDGCPEADNDKDGVNDNQDACPLKPETKNGFKDDDGCPDEPDSDADGVPDSKDKCPQGKEDTDGFEDTDGCPDPDNDKDGVPDNQDECIDEPEDKNGFKDEDGCPDADSMPKMKAGDASLQGGVIAYGGTIKFGATNAKLVGRESYNILDSVARVIKKNKDIKVEIIATGDGKLAGQRAEAIRRYMSGQGAPRSRMSASKVDGGNIVFKVTKK